MATQKNSLLTATNAPKKAGAADTSGTPKLSAKRNLSAARASARKALRLAGNHNLTVR